MVGTEIKRIRIVTLEIPENMQKIVKKAFRESYCTICNTNFFNQWTKVMQCVKTSFQDCWNKNKTKSEDFGKRNEDRMKKLMIIFLLTSAVSAQASDIICEYGNGATYPRAIDDASSNLKARISKESFDVSAPAITTWKGNDYYRPYGVSICVTTKKS